MKRFGEAMQVNVHENQYYTQQLLVCPGGRYAVLSRILQHLHHVRIILHLPWKVFKSTVI